ncbi:MAG: riboflavin kinase [Hyphomonadaceae bacterium]
MFEFDRELYGEHIEVELIAFLRDEAKFDDVEALKAQMAKTPPPRNRRCAGAALGPRASGPHLS